MFPVCLCVMHSISNLDLHLQMCVLGGERENTSFRSFCSSNCVKRATEASNSSSLNARGSARRRTRCAASSTTYGKTCQQRCVSLSLSLFSCVCVSFSKLLGFGSAAHAQALCKSQECHTRVFLPGSRSLFLLFSFPFHTCIHRNMPSLPFLEGIHDNLLEILLCDVCAFAALRVAIYLFWVLR